MNNTRLEFLFERYRDGSCTQEEELELLEYITANDTPEVKRLLGDLWQQAPTKLPPAKAELILNSILGKTDAKVVALPKKNFLWAKAAAVTALLAVAGISFYQVTKTSSANTPIAQGSEPQQDHQFLTLPDGSTVILNNASTLTYSPSFEGKNVREVYLKGEAFFDIKHEDGKPFIVHTGKISTTVLGTAFNIKAYPEQNDITVTVARGKVKVSDEVQVLGILKMDEQITFHKKSEQVNFATVVSEEEITWIEKDILFDDVSMEEAAMLLEQRFNIKVTFENEKLKACRFTATFIKGEDLNQILDVICAFNQANYNAAKSGDIHISGPGC
jgi:transmembrane sensor